MRRVIGNQQLKQARRKWLRGVLRLPHLRSIQHELCVVELPWSAKSWSPLLLLKQAPAVAPAERRQRELCGSQARHQRRSVASEHFANGFTHSHTHGTPLQRVAATPAMGGSKRSSHSSDGQLACDG